jgi:diguanylate cyclase (GGDEF)-like protein
LLFNKLIEINISCNLRIFSIKKKSNLKQELFSFKFDFLDIIIIIIIISNSYNDILCLINNCIYMTLLEDLFYKTFFNNCGSCKKDACEWCRVVDWVIVTTKESLDITLWTNFISDIILRLFEKNKKYIELKIEIEKLQKEREKIRKEIEEWKKEREELQKCAFRDSLTQIWNRAAHDLYLDQVIAEDNRSSINNRYYLFLDLNDFKLINDNFWHDIWDAALIHVAQILKKVIRESDKVFRYWWDEFAIISFDNDSKWIQEFINKIKNAVKNNPYIDKIWKEYFISISIWTCHISSWYTAEKVHKCADNALYCIKRNWKCEGCFIEWDFCNKKKNS